MEKKENEVINPSSKKGLKVSIIFLVVVISLIVLVDVILRAVPLQQIITSSIKSVSNKNVTITDNGIAESVNKLYDATIIVKVGTEKQMSGWGSGFVYKTDNQYGYAFTNHHVIEEAEKIVVLNTQGDEVEAELIGSDEYVDVAVIKFPVDNVLSTATIGKSSDLRLGDTIFAIGTPVSMSYKFSVNRGIVSGKDRMVQMNSSSKGIYAAVTDSWYMSLLQIDASINSGNSGGPLANANGEVVGITNSKISKVTSTGSTIENIGFAIPIEVAVNAAEMIEKDGKVTRPVIGVTLGDVSTGAYSQYEIDESIKYGALLTSVNDGGAASKAGLKAGDVVVKVGDNKVENYKYFKYYIYLYKPGDKIEITYIRGDKEKTTTLTLG